MNYFKNYFKLFVTILLVITCTSTTLAFNSSYGKFKKLKNVPIGAPVYYSANEVFFPAPLEKDKRGKFVAAGAKIYNVDTQKTTDLNSKMNISRGSYIAVNLNNSKILIVGGEENNRRIKTAELFDFNTNKFEIIGNSNFTYSKSFSTAITLDNGNILLINGSKMEIFNPKTKKFTIAGNHRKIKPNFTATYSFFRSGEFLVIEGSKVTLKNLKTVTKRVLTDKNELKKYSKEIDEYNKQNTPEEVCTLNYYTVSRAVKLNDGRIYIVGKIDDSVDDNGILKAEIYDPKTNKSVPANAPERTLRNMVTLQDGRVLFIDGYIYDPKTNKISKTAHLNEWRDNQNSSLLLSDGNVLVVGGVQFLPGICLKSSLPIEIYIPNEDKYVKVNKKVFTILAITLNSNKVMVPIYNGSAFIYKY